MAKRKRKKKRTQKKRTRFKRCPEFSLEDWRAFDIGTFMWDKKNDSSDLGKTSELILALSLFYNDIKDLMWMAFQLSKGKPPNDRETIPYIAQWHGMQERCFRIFIGMSHELFELMRTYRETIDSSYFSENISNKIDQKEKDSWQVLCHLAFENENRDNDKFKISKVLFKLFVQMRNSSAFHYYNPKSLISGYSDRYIRGCGDWKREKIWASISKNPERTRFYFADGAAQQLLQNTMNKQNNGLEDWKLTYGLLIDLQKYINIGVPAVVMRYLKFRAS